MRRASGPLRALFWKEWREQRWRLALSVMVLTILSASLVRAQLLPTAESLVIVFGPLGLVLSIFMAMGPIPPEKADGTWHFLISQPIRQSKLMAVKWAVCAGALVSAFFLAGVAAYLAAVSRGLFDQRPMPSIPREPGTPWIIGQNDPVLLIMIVVSACAAFIGFYSLLFSVMTRARNELHAGLAGFLVSLVVLAWACQYTFLRNEELNSSSYLPNTFTWYSSLLNPLSPLLFLAEPHEESHLLAVGMAPLFWIGCSVLYWLRCDRKVNP